MRILAACALALTLGSCAADPRPVVPTAEQSAARDHYVACLWKAAKASDDHISDAATIGLAILPMCAADYRRSMDAWTAGMSLYEKAMFLKQADADRLELATEAVVKSRQQ